VTAGGKNIAPQPIENALKKNKFISQVVVLGDKMPYLSCLIVPNYENLEERGLERTNSKLPGFSTIKAFGLLVEEFTLESDELTPTLKVKRRVIQENYKDKIATLYNNGD
jgi:long-chain acyl-CoA synthetase